MYSTGGVLGREGAVGCRLCQQLRDGNAAGVEIGDVVSEGDCEGVLVEPGVDVCEHVSPNTADVCPEARFELLLPHPGRGAELDRAGGPTIVGVDPDRSPPDLIPWAE